MENKDYVTDGRGRVVSNTGEDALLRDVRFCLTVRRGSFPLLPDFGSRLHLLQEAEPSLHTALARRYAAEALAGREDVTVTDARAVLSGERLTVRVELVWRGKTLCAEWEG